MVWGGTWGAFPWAAAFGSGPSMRLAWVSSRNAIDVEFSGPLLATEATNPVDALNPANWHLQSVTVGAFVPLIQVVESPGDGSVIRVIFDSDLTDAAEYLIAVSPFVVDLDGNAVSAPLMATVTVPRLGFVPVTSRVPGEARTDIRSVAGAKSATGTPRYDETGDLANESGIDYLRKRIMRRMTIAQGGFFHLPNYGARKALKTLISPASLSEYESIVRGQVLQEPDVLEADVSVTLLARNIVRTSVTPTNVQSQVLPEIVTVRAIDG